jgi:shikimate dehydrogenase
MGGTSRVVTGTSKTVGIIGDPVTESLSPRLQNAAFSFAGLDLSYTAWQVSGEDLAEAILAVRACGIAGLNVTMPHKAAVIKYLDYVDKEARLIDSVNTIVNSNGKLKGYSTDGEGFRLALTDAGYDPAGRIILIIGAGGAARAIARALGLGRAKQINVACRNLASGQRLAEIVKSTGVGSTLFDLIRDASGALKDSDLIINATPLGKYSIDDLKFLTDGLRPEQFVADLSTVPPLSAFLAAAQERGCIVMGGLGMLVRQGSLSYKLWTGLEAPVDVMRRAVGEKL